MSVNPVLIDIPTAAEALGIGTTKCKELIATGELRSVKIDRRRLVPADEPARYLDRLLPCRPRERPDARTAGSWREPTVRRAHPQGSPECSDDTSRPGLSTDPAELAYMADRFRTRGFIGFDPTSNTVYVSAIEVDRTRCTCGAIPTTVCAMAAHG